MSDRLTHVRALADVHLFAKPDAFGVVNYPLIRPDDPAYVGLKAPRQPQLLGLDPQTVPLSTIIGLLPSNEIAERFGSYDEAVRQGIVVRNGAVLLYGLQTAAIRDHDTRAAEALIRAAHSMTFLFQYDPRLIGLLEPARADAILMDLTGKWNPQRALLVWALLEDHRDWSESLSERILDSIADSGTSSRNGVWTWRGNGVAENLHPTSIDRAIEVLNPFAKSEANAKRWVSKLRKRSK